MGVFNGNSIYNEGGAGGGGGGYNDGGNLTPSAYIELENNSFYKLEGNDAANINFVIDGESGVLNSIVEISTNVDSTVSVYVRRNGLLYILSAIDNLIYSNKNYRLVISGDSYTLEEIINVAPTISKAEINGVYYDVFQFGNKIITQDLGAWFTPYEYESLLESLNGEWTYPTKTFIDQIKNDVGIDAMRSTSGWNNTQGTNTSGLDFFPYGVDSYGTIYDAGKASNFWSAPRDQTGRDYISIWYNSIHYSTYGNTDKIRARLVKEL